MIGGGEAVLLPGALCSKRFWVSFFFLYFPFYFFTPREINVQNSARGGEEKARGDNKISHRRGKYILGEDDA